MEAALHKMVNRWATPRLAPAAVPLRSVPTGTVQLQSTMRVSSPRDPAEKEAEVTAKKIMRMAVPELAVASGEGSGGPGDTPPRRRLESPYIARFADSIRLMRQHGAPAIARRGEGQPDAGANLAADITQSQGAGSPLPSGVRRFMEPRFGADFSKVRIHTGEKSARLNRQVSAQAFTVGNQIFFGRNQFRPDTTEGQELIAHELTHTLQQGAAVQQSAPVQRREDVTVAEQASPHVQRLGVSDALGYFADAANALPGFRMFTIVLGVNPITMSRVDRSAANILRAIVEFLPGGALITRALDNYGVFDRVGGWIEQQLASLGLSGSTIREALNRFLDSLSLSDVFNLGGVWERARRIFTEPIDRLLRFARGLFGAILGFIKDAILRPIAQLVSRTRGWDLLCAVLGVNPITGDAVPRTAETLIGGFMKLIGQEEIWENIKRGNAIARAWSWFQGALSGVLGFVRQIPQRFVQAVMGLELEDLVLPPRAFARVAGVFGDFIGSFLSWAGNTAWELLEIIFSVVAPSVMVYLRRAAGAFRTILQNPVGFVGYLVRAAMLGFRQFASRFLTHLRGSLIGWLTGALSGANIYIPQAFNLREIIKFVLSVLGLTWQNIRQKIVRVIGEPAMRALETGFELVMTLVTQGPAAAWEKLQESLSNLREMVMEQIMTFVQDRVVTAAVTRLVSMLSPAGAFIQAIIAIYNTVMFFMERLRQIAQVATSFIDSISAIAAGNIAFAANRVEQTMGGLLTLVISFLARLVGLGRVSDAVTNVVNRVRAPIDRALDRVVEWIVAQARRLGRLIVSAIRGPDIRTPEEKQRDLDRAVRELTPPIQRMLLRGSRRLVLRARMFIWKQQYRLTDLSIVGGKVRATINPTCDMFDVEEKAIGALLEPILQGAERAHLQAIAQRDSADRLAAARRTPAQPFPPGMTQEERVILIRERFAAAEEAHREGRPLPQAQLGAERTVGPGQGPRTHLRVKDGNLRLHVVGGQSYAPPHLPGMSPPPDPNSPRDTWPPEYRSRTDRDVRRIRAIWLRSINIAGEQGRLREGHEVVRDEVEIARAPGNLAAQRIGTGLLGLSMVAGRQISLVTNVNVPGAANVVSVNELQYGRLAPMATDSSSGIGSAADVRRATEVRQGTYAVLFNTLRQAVQQNQDALVQLPGRSGEAMHDLTNAYERWCAVAWTGGAIQTGPQVDTARQTLQTALERFLATLREQ